VRIKNIDTDFRL